MLLCLEVYISCIYIEKYISYRKCTNVTDIEINTNRSGGLFTSTNYFLTRPNQNI